MERIPDPMRQRIAESPLFQRREGVLAAVSGGADSMVLLELLAGLAGQRKMPVVVAHFNHQLRGVASNEDERFVRTAARRAKLLFVVERGDVRGFARREAVSLEMAGRRLRHEFLARHALRLGLPRVALAHHAGDQVELFLLRLLRGAGPAGLAGMRETAPSPADSRITLVRPLLPCSRAEILAYATRHGVGYREDASNRSLDVQRNRVRHELLPLLRRRYQSSVDTVVLRLMQILRAEEDFISGLAQDWIASGAGDFEELPLALKRRCIFKQLLHMGLTPDFELVERLCSTPGKAVCAVEAGQSGPVLVLREPTGRVHTVESDGLAFNPDSREVSLGTKGETAFGDLKLSWRVVEQHGLHGARFAAHQEIFDAGKIGPVIRLRHWRPGDRFQPSGMSKAAKLQDLLCNLKIPVAERRRLALAETGGEIFWVEGLRIAEQFKLSARSERRLLWRWNRS